MRKSFAISMLLFYLVFSTGLVVNLHYCGEGLMETALFKESKSCCQNANTTNSCCKNSHAFYKIDEPIDKGEFTIAKISLIKLTNFNALNFVPIFKLRLLDTLKVNTLALHRMPQLGKQPRYISHCVLII